MAASADACWLGLRRVHGVGPRVYRLLLERFGTPQEVFARSEEELAAVGVPRATARNIRAFRDFDAVERELCELPRLGARLVRWTDADYPINLREIADPPPYFFLRGSIAHDDPRCVAVVGARTGSEAGLRMAHRLGMELAGRGFTVVSGLARGIDGAAHQGALEGGGRTVAILGCGIDTVYPPEHRKLADALLERHGALISELPVGTPPLAENFPARNRILAGLCLGVVIVEAAERSGSLITARMALEQNRQVFAVPGSPLTGKTRGSNRLLKQGAVLVECVEDVIEELSPQLGKFAPAPRPLPALGANAKETADSNETAPEAAQARAILERLSKDEKTHIDAVIEGCGLNPQTVLRLLLELELNGVVAQHPGKLFSLR
jgi:DNA processing protein